MHVRAVLPSIALAILVLLAVLPWGMGERMQNAVTLLPVVALFAMNARRAHAVPDWIAFLCGVVMDCLGDQPLGFWALMLLAVYAMAVFAHRLGAAPLASRWVSFALALVVVTGLGWAVASLYAFTAQPWHPQLQSTLVAVMLYPLLDVLVATVAPVSDDEQLGSLQRGG